MKKLIKVFLIVLIVLSVAVGAVALWQRKNIEGVLIGIRETSEEIEKRRDENQSNLVKEIDSYIETTLRELTPEEQKQIEEGTIQASEVYSKIFEEKSSQIEQSKTDNKQKKDEIITKYMAQLYKLQSEFTSRSEATISEGARYYEKLKKTQDKASARANTITHFTPIVKAIESECDSKVNEVIKNLTNELSAIGANTDIVGTIKASYDNEKQLKLAYYSNKYLK